MMNEWEKYLTELSQSVSPDGWIGFGVDEMHTNM